MGGFYHYECWLELGRQRIVKAVLPRRAPDQPSKPPASTPDQLTMTFDSLYERQERRRRLSARIEGWCP